ncbi:MAG: chlorite dismutase family protein [Gemmatimonadota bacterium]
MSDESRKSAEDPGTETSATLNHFGVYRFTPEFWALEGDRRAAVYADLVAGVATAVGRVHPYQLTPLESDADVMLWTAKAVADREVPGAFFADLSRALSPFRRYLQPRDSLWGLTRPSQYSRAKSAQEVDPLAPERSPYLVMYPFTKTSEWYLLGGDIRQTMMNEHIRIGKQYREISQLLLYSVGLQDQEFVVVYETEDLSLFSTLVKELRETEARRFTKRDTPVHTGLFCPADAIESPWAGC